VPSGGCTRFQRQQAVCKCAARPPGVVAGDGPSIATPHHYPRACRRPRISHPTCDPGPEATTGGAAAGASAGAGHEPAGL